MKHILIIIVSVFFVIIAVQAHAMTYTFEWSGVVGAIEDGFGDPETLPGVNVGDTFLVATTYNTSLFGSGVVVTSDGLDYAAPAGLQMTYQFSSGGNFTANIVHARARDGGSFDQWTWQTGPGGHPIIFMDNSDTSYDLPLPTSFDAMHTLFLSSISNFVRSGSIIYLIASPDPLTVREVIRDELANEQLSISQVSVVPEPSTMLLLGGGLLILVLFMRKRT